MSTRSVPSSRRTLAKGVVLLGCSLAAAPHADAAIVGLDLGPSGFNLLDPNCGAPNGGFRNVANFPVSGPVLKAFNGYYRGLVGGTNGSSVLSFAINGAYASPRNFGIGGTIDGTANWSTDVARTGFKFGTAFTSPDFGAGSFMAFRFSTDGGTNWNYGWLEVTWFASTNTFQLYGGAYESTAGVAIQAGATGGGGAVPLPGAAGLAACGLLGLGRRRRR
jgi:hypothetical protein